jgi:ATP-dependent Lhr-like helicase
VRAFRRCGHDGCASAQLKLKRPGRSRPTILVQSPHCTRLAFVKADSQPLAAHPGFALPEPFASWFAGRGWQPRAHQLELLAETAAGRSMLLIAPTGAGKTLAGFLPSLTDLAVRGKRKPGQRAGGSLHTLYISPLKALAVDIERNLARPVTEMDLPIRIETRTGDTPQSKRARQRTNPPDILLTTPEQVSLLIANPHAERLFKDLRFVIFDELHSLIASKRGHLLSLALARLRRLAPGLQTIGLSATVADPEELQRWLVPKARAREPCRGDQGSRAGPARSSPFSKRTTDTLVRAFGALRHPGYLRDHQGASHRTDLRQHP